MSSPVFPDPLEKIFQRVEEESIVRARQVEREAARALAQQKAQTHQRPKTSSGLVGTSLSINTNAAPCRRSSSVSFTRLTQSPSQEESPAGDDVLTSPTKLHFASFKPPVYHSGFGKESKSSLSTVEVPFDDLMSDHVTQVETIPPKQSFGRTLGSLMNFPLQRLGRAPSANGKLCSFPDRSFQVAIEATSETKTEVLKSMVQAQPEQSQRTEIIAGRRKMTVSGSIVHSPPPVAPVSNGGERTLGSLSPQSSVGTLNSSGTSSSSDTTFPESKERVRAKSGIAKKFGLKS